MPRRCFALDLKNDPQLIAEYEQHHRPGGVWPTVTADIRAEGYEGMQIWRSGTRMFMIAEVSEDFPRHRRSAETQREVDRWEALMTTFQQILPHAPSGVRWMPMDCVFDLADH